MTVVAAAREQAVERITAPFKGLTYFTEEDSEIFFGRKAERLLIATTLLASRFTVVYGESGVGKSSLLRAGAVHDLRERALGELAERGGGGPARHAPRFIPAVVSDWRDDPIAACDESIRAAAAGLVSGLPPGPFAGKRFDELLESWCRSTGATLLIVLDQFEEYLLYHQSDEDSIGAGLARAIARRDLSVRFMVSIREDALAKLDRYEGGIPTLFENFIRIEHLDKEAGEAAITGPIDRYNAGLEPGEERVEIEGELVEKVLAQIERDEPGVAAKSSPRAGGGARVETVFLQLVMERLWNEERKANSNVLKVATFDALGGAKQIVFAHLKDAMDDLTDDEQAIAAKAFGRLVTPSRQKIAYLPSDLATADDVAPAQMTSVLERLSQRRIVRPVAPPPDSAESRYEIFHDVLADPVLAWRARYEEERALRHADEQRRRAWFVAGAALVGLVIVATIAVFALVERSDARSQARTAHARELVANALTSLDDDPTASLRFALTAAQLEQARRPEPRRSRRPPRVGSSFICAATPSHSQQSPLGDRMAD
jgi:hypothetical protein